MKRLFRVSLVNRLRSLVQNSRYRWAIIFGSLLYLFSPLDISPDIIPVVGWIDDGLLATLVMTELTQMTIDNRRDHLKNSTQRG